VGTTYSTPAAPSARSTRSRQGASTASVFPLPVAAWRIRSWPCKSGVMTSIWNGRRAGKAPEKAREGLGGWCRGGAFTAHASWAMLMRGAESMVRSHHYQSQREGGTGVPRRRQMVRTVGRFNVVWRGTGALWWVAGLIQIV